MSDKLNIPLGSTSSPNRHTLANWQKKWLFGTLTFIVLLGASRIWITRDLTSNFHTHGIESTIRIIKTPSTTRQVHENIGSKAVISGSSITFDDILLLADREFALHLDEFGVIREISIDTRLNDLKARSLRESGLSIYESGHKTIISNIETDVLIEKFSIHPIRALNPWYDGEITGLTDGKKISISLSITNNGIKITTGYKEKQKIYTAVLENTKILALFTIQSTELIPLLAKTLFTNAITTDFLSKISESGYQIVLGQDSQGDSFYITIPTANTNSQEAAVLAQELLKPYNLSTLALTMDDGTDVEEIRTDVNALQSSIETESGMNVLTVSDSNGNIIYIVQTNEFWRISNRKTTLTSVNSDYQSTCNPNAHSFLRPAKLINNQISNNSVFSQTTEIPFLLQFSEVAISNTNTKLCW